MRDKIILSISIFILILFSFAFVFINKSEIVEKMELSELKKIKIAACPTCYELAKGLNMEKYQIILTNSTAESIEFLTNNQVDMILAGRTLKPSESQFDYLVIKEGYSFLSSESKIVYFSDLENYNIYSDLKIEQLPESLKELDIEYVSDVYDYLDKGIIVTSWDNTDYNKGNIVHVLEKDGKRSKLSRRPTIYCPKSCTDEANILVNLINN